MFQLGICLASYPLSALIFVGYANHAEGGGQFLLGERLQWFLLNHEREGDPVGAVDAPLLQSRNHTH